VDLDSKNAAIRTSDIEDYLQRNEIVEKLNDFSFDKLVYSDEGEKYEVPYESMGDGFKTIVGILWELHAGSGTKEVLLLEEPERHMHPGYVYNVVDQMIELVKQLDLQLFITTHNTDLIEAFLSDKFDKKRQKYLRDHFKLIQLTEPVHRTLDYDSAKEEVNNLNVDLRGI
jgi:AAA15 family ATPase/GTPase